MSLSIFHYCVLLFNEDALKRLQVIYAVSCQLSQFYHESLSRLFRDPTPSQVSM